MAFGGSKIAYSIFGWSLVAISIVGFTLEWVGEFGGVFWVLVGLYGFIGHVCLTGHFVFFRWLAKYVRREEAN